MLQVRDSTMCVPQAKLNEGLSLAKEFHSSVQDLLTKMSKCEDSIGLLPAPSVVLDVVSTQLQDHRVRLLMPDDVILPLQRQPHASNSNNFVLHRRW